MMLLIAAILVAVPSVVTACGEEITLSSYSPLTTFHTPYYPGFHPGTVNCSWTVSAPENIKELEMSCSVDSPKSTGCKEVSFSFTMASTNVTFCGKGIVTRTLSGPSATFTFRSSMPYNQEYKGINCKVSYKPKCLCGQKGGQRIVGGNEVTPNEYPWQVLVMYKSTRFAFCGGSVIAKQWVLSASHCFSTSLNPFHLLLDIGEHDQSTADQISQDYEVTQIITHEKFNIPGGLNNDIALLKVAKPIIFNQFISPICLPFRYKNFEFSGLTGTTTGFGLTIPGNYYSLSKVLKEIDVKLIMSYKCDYFNGHGWAPSQVNENMICGKADDGGACQGDSGGPLNWKSLTTNNNFQLGIVSFGSTCASKVTPTVYTYVPNYVDWIVEKTGAGEEFCAQK